MITQEIKLIKIWEGFNLAILNIRKTCGCAKPKKSNFKKLPFLALELTKTEGKKKFFHVHVLLLVYFPLPNFKTHTLFLSVQV